MDLNNIPAYLPDKLEIELFGEISPTLHEQGFVKKEQLLKIVRWKSPRAIPRADRNPSDIVEDITRTAFDVTDEKYRMRILCTLDGVDIPMASSILTIWEPKKFGVIDIRAWYSLFKLGLVEKEKPTFDENDWIKYLDIIQKLAKEYKCTPREIDAKLYTYFDQVSEGRKVYQQR